MKCVLLDAGSPSEMHPLTCTRPLAECAVANITFRAAQLERLRDTGLDVDAAPGAGETCLYVTGSAWLPAASITAAVGAGADLALRDPNGNLLAWIGSDSSGPAEGVEDRTDNDALAVRHPWDLLAVNERLVGALAEDGIDGEVSAGVNVDGHIRMGAGARLLPGVYIEGNVLIGRNCKIGPNCYIRGNTSIGDNCHVGNAVEIKNSILMTGASIGHLSYCGDSVIGERVNFGAGTITANLRHDGRDMRSLVDGKPVRTGRRKFGTIVGDDAHLGIHTSIYPGRKIWPGCTTLPGQAVSMDITE